MQSINNLRILFHLVINAIIMSIERQKCNRGWRRWQVCIPAIQNRWYHFQRLFPFAFVKPFVLTSLFPCVTINTRYLQTQRYAQYRRIKRNQYESPPLLYTMLPTDFSSKVWLTDCVLKGKFDWWILKTSFTSL